MKINDVEFNCSLEEVLTELRSELAINYSPYLQKNPKPSGTRSLQVQCPYHGDGQERKPSAGIRKSDGMFHCFACGAIHTLPEVISHCFGKYDDIMGSFGWSWLLKNFATIQKEVRKDIELDFDRSKRVEKKSKYISEQELDSYRYFHPYMYERKLTDEIIDLFDIGYDKDTECLTFPVRDINGNCLFIARRSVKTKYFNYPEGVEKPLYGLYELMKVTTNNNYRINITEKGHERGLYNISEVMVCESMLDSLTCWVYGKYAVALNGTGNELQMKQLRELPCRKIILATDNDKAGMEARTRLRENLPYKIVTEYILPEGKKDINELSEEEFNNLEEVF